MRPEGLPDRRRADLAGARELHREHRRRDARPTSSALIGGGPAAGPRAVRRRARARGRAARRHPDSGLTSDSAAGSDRSAANPDPCPRTRAARLGPAVRLTLAIAAGIAVLAAATSILRASPVFGIDRVTVVGAKGSRGRRRSGPAPSAAGSGEACSRRPAGRCRRRGRPAAGALGARRPRLPARAAHPRRRRASRRDRRDRHRAATRSRAPGA